MTSRPIVRASLLWLAGIDLRLTLLALPPIIPLIHRDLGLDESAIAALSNLPVLVLALSSVFGALFTAKLGARGALVLGLFAIAIPSALRGAGTSAPMLFAMTLLMGVGIAISQPAFPSLARAWFPERVALATGIWANGLLSGEALSASLTIPFMLPLAGGSWQASLALWSVPVLLTAVALALFGGPGDVRPAVGVRWFPDFRDRRVLQIGTYQSAASLAYFGANTFLPDYLHSTGQANLIAPALAALNIGQIPASFAVGLLPMAVLGRRTTSFAAAGMFVAALVAFLLLGGGAVVVASALFGLFAAYVLTMSFALPALVGTHDDVPRISAGSFTLGYSISFVTTLLSGAAWDATHVAAAAFVPMFAAAVIVVVLGPRLGTAAQRYDVA
ncbi:MAG: major facilitator transporter [Candidatus Eremiobacteraeota bacterium]|nr:major facilitator transporter [Candidatus Eremiobacteraeota bacterium]